MSGRLLGDPLVAPAVHDAAVGVAEELEGPEGVAGPPVVLVAVEHDRRVVGDAALGAEAGELVAADVVADGGVLEVVHPVDVDGAGDVAGAVEQEVLVGLDDADVLGVTEVLGDPVGGDEDIGVGVVGHGRWGRGERGEGATSGD